MYELYKYNINSVKKSNIKKFDLNLQLVIHKISLFSILTSKHFIYDLYWFLNTKGNCWVYSVFDGNIEIHYSYVTKHCYKFPFMRKHDLQIGNCFTDEKYRGLGIYPFVIGEVVQKYLESDCRGDVFMLIEQDNFASQNGVEKVGFEKVSSIRTKKILGLLKVYQVSTEINR